jgi:hypothetical protein
MKIEDCTGISAGKGKTWQVKMYRSPRLAENLSYPRTVASAPQRIARIEQDSTMKAAGYEHRRLECGRLPKN